VRPSTKGGRAKPVAKKRSTKTTGRQSTPEAIRRLVWIRAAGHCELCGRDITDDPRMRSATRWGEVAHVLPAGPAGPRATAGYTSRTAREHTADPSNLIAACPDCHTLIDRDPDLHSTALLLQLHRAQVERIRLTASQPNASQTMGLFFIGHHFATHNNLSERALVPAMLSDGMVPIDFPERVNLPEPPSSGLDAAYLRHVEDIVEHKVESALRRAASMRGDPPILSVAALADIPSLMLLGRKLGDRIDRRLFSFTRDRGFEWTGPNDPAPEFSCTVPTPGPGPIALVLSLSAIIPTAQVLDTLPSARLAVLTVPEPNYGLVRNRQTISIFRDFLQARLSEFEAAGPEPIHVFAAIPAALAVEFGALLSTQHRHPYVVYDRGSNNRFEEALRLT
ncbi:MAG: HNH endonuclease, partial [Burkholderiales bacterium]